MLFGMVQWRTWNRIVSGDFSGFGWAWMVWMDVENLDARGRLVLIS